MKTVNVIGCGLWAQNHIRVLSKLNILNGVNDINESLAKETASKYRCKFLSEDQLKNDINNNTCLFILSSAFSHFELLKKYIPIYKNIFVEKPLVETLEQYFEIKKLIDTNNNKIAVGHLINFHQVFIKFKQLVVENKIGKLLGFKSIRNNFGRYRENEDVVQSLAIHDLSILFNITKELNLKLQSHDLYGFDFLKKNHFDEARIILNFDNGVKGVISSSWISPVKEHVFTIFGSVGIAVFEDTEDLDKKLFIQYYDKNNNEITKLHKEYINFDVKNYTEPLDNEIIQTIDYFSGKNFNYPTTFDESYLILKIISKSNKINDDRLKLVR